MLKELENSDWGILYLDDRIIESDFPTRLCIKLEYVDYYIGETEAKDVGKYWCSVYALGDQWPDDKALASYLDTLGMTIEDWLTYNDESRINILIDTGLGARLWHDAGNNKRALLKTAREEIEFMQIFFGFYMDKPQNAIGSTGWDFIRGDILGGLQRAKEQV